MSEIVILSATRTPIGAFQGALSTVPAPRLGATAIHGALVSSGIDPSLVTDVAMGNVLQAGLGQAPARQAAIHAGLPPATRAVTVHKVCGSGLQAILQSAHALSAGFGQVHVAGGMESMSRAPYLLPKAREGFRLGHQQAIDSLVSDGLWDPYHDMHMGACAELCVKKYQFTRAEQDAFAIASFERAQAAQKNNHFAHELTPVAISEKKSPGENITHDEGPGRAKFEKIPTLKPAFQTDGSITAANASSLNDGAAALLLSTREFATAHGLRPPAKIVSFGAHADDPRWFSTAPIYAARQALSAAGWSVKDVDMWEVNEAFAAVPLAFMRELGVAHAAVNIHGGAIALGHPIGASGARIVVTLLHALRTHGKKRGLATICIGGGEALAICVESIG